MALLHLARSIASSPLWNESEDVRLIARPDPWPILGIVGRFTQAETAQLATLGKYLNGALAHIRYISYAQAEQDCECLAEQLIDRFGRDNLRTFAFAAIPRGGFVVLGMLAYILGIDTTQLEFPNHPDTPLVIVDDCVLTGARFGRFLACCKSQSVIFAHLYSHPDLRKSIEVQEPRVRACLSAHDLHDYEPESSDDEYPAWREHWIERLSAPRYWIGQTEHVCFPWNEPDRLIWNPVAEQVETAWHIVPSELCLKNRLPGGAMPVSVQVQPEGKSPLKPSAATIFGEFDNAFILGNLKTGKSFRLEGIAADMWRAIVAYGNPEDVVVALLKTYEVELDRLRTDLETFITRLCAQGLLEGTDPYQLRIE